MGDQGKNSILGHLSELRRRLLLCVIVLFITVSASFYPTKYVIDFLKSRAPDVQLIYTKPTEMIGTYIQVSLYLGIGVAMPFILYQALMFISPALTRKEKRYLYTVIPAVAFCFVAGVAFAYFVLLPPGLRFLLTFGSDIADPMISVGAYVGLVTKLMFWVGVVFEIPVVMYYVSKLGIISPAWFARKRKWAFVGAFILSAIITPTVDPVNQTLVAVPIIVLYEIGIWVSRLAQVRSRTRVATERVPSVGA
jgi:sec-independent protein translocase protein TatC